MQRQIIGEAVTNNGKRRNEYREIWQTQWELQRKITGNAVTTFGNRWDKKLKIGIMIFVLKRSYQIMHIEFRIVHNYII